MTNHREIEIRNSMEEITFQLGFVVAHGDSSENVLKKIKEHIRNSHYLESGIIFNKEVCQHMAASFRMPNKFSKDDAVLPSTLDLPRLVYDTSLPPNTDGDPKKTS